MLHGSLEMHWYYNTFVRVKNGKGHAVFSEHIRRALKHRYSKPAFNRAHDWERPIIKAVTRDKIVNTDGRRFYARCIVTQEEDGRYYADLTGPQGSGILTSMSAANGLTVIPEDVAQANPGDEINVMMIDWEHHSLD